MGSGLSAGVNAAAANLAAIAIQPAANLGTACIVLCGPSNLAFYSGTSQTCFLGKICTVVPFLDWC